MKQRSKLWVAITLLACSWQLSQANPVVLTIADIHYGSKNTSVDGQDLGDEFLAVALKKFEALSKKASFILVLGDLPTHVQGYAPEKAIDEAKVFHDLLRADVARVPMFYVSGNNDPLSGNYQPFQETKGQSPLSLAKAWNGACVYCTNLLIDKRRMRDAAYYSAYPLPGSKEVVLVVLNTTQWAASSPFRREYPNQEVDAREQLAWLKKQLAEHKAKQLLIAMHIPPGNDYRGASTWKQPYLDEFLSLLGRYQSRYQQITLLTAHTHMDDLRKIRLPKGKAIYGFATPGVSRIHYNNSGIKLFYLNAGMQVQSYTTYYSTSIHKWGTLHYRSSDIFLNCKGQYLAQCLDGWTGNTACAPVAAGLFYGVKSKAVSNDACFKSFLVNE